MQQKISNIIKEEPFIGEDGLEYIKITKEILTPRKTYLKGTINGKYRGDKIWTDSNYSNLYDFEIYEATVVCDSVDDFSKNIPFVYPDDFKSIIHKRKIKGKAFPKDKLPATLAVHISANYKSFGVNILEPQLFEFQSNKKLHQTDGDEVFGSFNAYITGYVLDYERSEIEEIIPKPTVVGPEIISDPPIVTSFPCIASNIETGKVEVKGDYSRKEYLCETHNDTVWGKWNYVGTGGGGTIRNKSFDNGGCLGTLFSFIALIIGAFFLIKLFPFLLIFVGYYLFVFLIGIFAPLFKWLFRIIALIFLIIFISELINDYNGSRKVYHPKPVIVDSPREQNPPVPVVDNSTTPDDSELEPEPIKDSLITRFRSWKDYSGHHYEGNYQIRLSDFKRANFHKNNLTLRQNSAAAYDQIVYELKEFDKNNFNSLYHLFDSIGKANKLNRIQFAEMVVSCIQDIPYALVLPDGCEASLYNDRFIRDYLLSNEGDCDGNQPYGINTPVEFLTNLKGDCDTRSLLLYTIFSHYNYDVALLSSEFYGHSILGINLPLNGAAYTYNNQRYVMWETTAPNCKPGIISNQFSNVNNWRISLKSK